MCHLSLKDGFWPMTRTAPIKNMRCFFIILFGLFAFLSTEGIEIKTCQAQEQKISQLQNLANQGDAEAQFNIGVMYDVGQGVPQDYAKAKAWYEKAAIQGHAVAQNNLGGMYASGTGVLQNFTKAKEWYEKSASQGLAGAQSNLGLLFANGNGVSQDYVQAHKWLNLAAAHGYKEAAKNRDLLASHMTPTQIAEAQRLAREWKPVDELIKITADIIKQESQEQKGRTGTWEHYAIPFDDLTLQQNQAMTGTSSGEGIVNSTVSNIPSTAQGKRKNSYPVANIKSDDENSMDMMDIGWTVLWQALLISTIITWGIGLIPPIFIRYVFLKRPMSNKNAIIVCGLFWLINLIIFIALGSESKTHVALYLIAWASYLILKKEPAAKRKIAH